MTQILYKLLCATVFVLIVQNAKSQITVTASQSATAMAQMLAGAGITVSNAFYNATCDSSIQSAKFTVTSSNLDMTNGILLTSGTSSLASGPSAVPSTPLNNAGDPDLFLLCTPQASNDACVLEFDFVPLGDTIKFKYVFASAEYQTFSCSIADVFGFFISGPGITGPFSNNSKNLAVLPNGCYVGVNTVNGQTTNPCGNASALCSPPNNALFYSNLPIGNTTTGVAYNGYTLPLYAVSNVIPCNTYHLKLAISDASDFILDSGVFLEAGSLSSNNIGLSFNTGIGINNPFIVEGCDSLVIKIRRNVGGATIVAPDTIGVLVGGNATMGADYTPIPSQVYFTASNLDTLQTIVVFPFLDGITEPNEFITLKLLQGCSGVAADSITIQIKDSLSFLLNNINTAICDGQTVSTSGVGYAGTIFTWLPAGGVANANTINTIITPPIGTTTYSVTGKYLGCPSETKSFTIIKDPIPAIALASTYSLCNGSQLQIGAGITSSAGITYNWAPSNNLLNANTLQPIFTGTASQNIKLTAVTNNAQCTSNATTNITVYNIATGTTNITDTLVCGGTSVQLIASGGLGNYLWFPNYFLSCTNCPNPIANPPNRTVYSVVFIEPHGCQDTSTIDLQINPPFTLVLTNPDTTTIEAGDSILLSSYGAFGYNWYPNYYLSAVNTGEVFAFPLASIGYTITGTDTFNTCPQTKELYINVVEKDFYIPNVFTPNGDGVNDVFRLSTKTYMKLQEFRIFNRWGNEIFSGRNINDGWDGTSKGKKCNVDTYYYTARWAYPSGKVKTATGDVLLMK